ncbi:MAG TPA: 23S rRNA (pseudouridine(1915)-N(3))-methyltransferase RlmH [Hanamia sp.]|jgi:23S rRNA (pseudouridine1915-N3)-methyltransferase|nr:23S rRNA (pseudouridine(1915)-N(3))-methyltransferase RlmH [Hanamia sp.]
MKLYFWSIGKPHESYVKEGVDLFTRRISYYYPVEWKIFPSPKSKSVLSENETKKADGQVILNALETNDVLVALDEKGKLLYSEDLADFIQQSANQSSRSIIFLIGGAYGLDEKVLERANLVWSLSKLVFPHQLVRLILAEQIYRACTILRNEKYHHT